MAVATMCDAKKGISAHQIKRHSQNDRTGCYLCHRIRKATQAGNIFAKLGSGGGIAAADETFIGGRHDQRRKRGPFDKQAVWEFSEPPVKSRLE
jgi:hypothetical protein